MFRDVVISRHPSHLESTATFWITKITLTVSRLQVYQLQQEKKKLQEDFAQLLKEREQLEERCSSYEHEKIQLGPRLEESKWEVSSTMTFSSAGSDDGNKKKRFRQ